MFNETFIFIKYVRLVCLSRKRIPSSWIFAALQNGVAAVCSCERYWRLRIAEEACEWEALIYTIVVVVCCMAVFLQFMFWWTGTYLCLCDIRTTFRTFSASEGKLVSYDSMAAVVLCTTNPRSCTTSSTTWYNSMAFQLQYTSIYPICSMLLVYMYILTKLDDF